VAAPVEVSAIAAGVVAMAIAEVVRLHAVARAARAVTRGK
jgi:hypothetical protein